MRVKIAAVVAVAALMVTIQIESVGIDEQYEPENMTYESVITNDGEDCGYFLLFYLNDEKEYEDKFRTKLKNLYDREFIIFSKSSTIQPGIYFLQISVNPENKIVNDTLIKNSGENETLVLNFIKILRGDYMNGCTRILYDVPVRVESVRRSQSSQQPDAPEEVAIAFRILPNSRGTKTRRTPSSTAHLCGGLFQQPQFMCPGESVLQQQQMNFMGSGGNYAEPCGTLRIVSHVASIEEEGSGSSGGGRSSNRHDFIASRRASKEAAQHGGSDGRALAENNSRKEVKGEAAAAAVDDERLPMADLHIQILRPKKTPAGTYRDDLVQYFGKYDINKQFTHYRNSMGNVWTSDDIKLETCKSSDSFIEPLGPCDIPYFGVEANYDCRNFFDPYDQNQFGYTLDLCEASLFGFFDLSPCDLLSFESHGEPCIIPNDAFEEDMSKNSSKKSLNDVYMILLLIAGILLCIIVCFFSIQTFNNAWTRRARRQRRVRL
ncbi:MAG: hypothetical protein MHMPM18_000666 [Marteilia pararefringens]